MSVIHIKNMVCSRCIESVENIFKKQSIEIKNIKLGQVIADEISKDKMLLLESNLQQKGFQILKKKKLHFDSKS